jgi:glycosyltransferase involved in cell wall biosynthesis
MDSVLNMDGNPRRQETLPRILLLVDRPGWAFDTNANALVYHLSDRYEFQIVYVADHPDLSKIPFELIFVYFWGETYHLSYVERPEQVIKLIASHRWALEEQYGLFSPKGMVQKYLQDAGTVVAISQRLQRLLSPYREVLWAPNGFEPDILFNRHKPQGTLKIGWAGNISDPCKGIKEIVLPAVSSDFDFRVAGGRMTQLEMAEFYNSIDAICVASTAEGEPLPLLEAMACGCFPICVDVGIVPELVTHRDNGLIVNRSIDAFRAAFQWCAFNLEYIRDAGKKNAAMMLEVRSWEKTIGNWDKVFQKALNLRKQEVVDYG